MQATIGIAKTRSCMCGEGRFWADKPTSGRGEAKARGRSKKMQQEAVNPSRKMIIQEMKDKNSKRYLISRSNETQEISR